MLRRGLEFVLLILLVGVVPATAQTPAAILAPTGTLRAVFLGGNPVQGRIDPATGAASGVVPDLIRELARSLGVPASILSRPYAADVAAVVTSGAADIGFLAYDEDRAREVDFGRPFLMMLNSYLVRADSTLQSSAEVDRPDVVVAAVRGQSQQLFVSRELKMARIRVLDEVLPQAGIERLLLADGVDALAINRQRSLDAAAASGERLRVLPDSFFSVGQAIVVDRGNRAKTALLDRFVSDMLTSGFVRAAIERANVASAATAAN
ncbi:MAG: transporter substrate-binding domain-containing protein [Vicinamibacterales bacterium]